MEMMTVIKWQCTLFLPEALAYPAKKPENGKITVPEAR